MVEFMVVGKDQIGAIRFGRFEAVSEYMAARAFADKWGITGYRWAEGIVVFPPGSPDPVWVYGKQLGAKCGP